MLYIYLKKQDPCTQVCLDQGYCQTDVCIHWHSDNRNKYSQLHTWHIISVSHTHLVIVDTHTHTEKTKTITNNNNNKNSKSGVYRYIYYNLRTWLSQHGNVFCFSPIASPNQNGHSRESWTNIWERTLWLWNSSRVHTQAAWLVTEGHWCRGGCGLQGPSATYTISGGWGCQHLWHQGLWKSMVSLSTC